jgi:hypothetical protein
LIENVKELELIGKHVALWSSEPTFGNRRFKESRYDVVCSILQNSKKPKEGVLNLLACLSQFTGKNNFNTKLSIFLDDLSDKGKLSLICLNLMSEDSTLDLPAVVENLQRLLISENTAIRTECESLLVVLRRRPQLSNYSIEVLSNLFNGSLSVKNKRLIMAGLINQTQFRDSRFSEPAEKERLAIPV